MLMSKKQKTSKNVLGCDYEHNRLYPKHNNEGEIGRPHKSKGLGGGLMKSKYFIWFGMFLRFGFWLRVPKWFWSRTSFTNKVELGAG